jgi:cytochrome c-type biogenesis protein
MEISQISVGLALLAGLASFLSPCVFSLVPAYVGYLGGLGAGATGENDKSNRWVTFSHGLAFVLGFSIVFVLLGVAAAFAGGLLYDLRFWLSKIGGVVVIVFGLHMIGVFHIPFLAYDTRVQQAPDPKWGYLSSVLMGVFFSAGWSPCVGPVLGAILTLAINGGSISLGAMLLTAYSIGLAIPFLIAALGIGWVTTILKKYGKAMRYVEIAMGVILVIIGFMLFAGVFELIAQQGQFFFFNFGI